MSYNLINIHVYKYSSGNLHRLHVLDAESNKSNSVDLSQVYCRCWYRFCPASMGKRMPKQYKAQPWPSSHLLPHFTALQHIFCFCAKLHADVRHKAIEHLLRDMLLVKCYQQTSSKRFKYWDSLDLPVPVPRESVSRCCSTVLNLGNPHMFHPTPASHPEQWCGGFDLEREEHSAARSSDSEHLRQQVT